MTKRRPKRTHPYPICNQRGYVAPHRGQHLVAGTTVSDEHWDTNWGQHWHLISNSDQVPRRCSCVVSVPGQSDAGEARLRT